MLMSGTVAVVLFAFVSALVSRLLTYVLLGVVPLVCGLIYGLFSLDPLLNDGQELRMVAQVCVIVVIVLELALVGGLLTWVGV